MKMNPSQLRKLMAEDGDKWITIHPNGQGNKGHHIMIDEETGEVKGGLGELNGIKIQNISRESKAARATGDLFGGEGMKEARAKHRKELQERKEGRAEIVNAGEKAFRDDQKKTGNKSINFAKTMVKSAEENLASLKAQKYSYRKDINRANRDLDRARSNLSDAENEKLYSAQQARAKAQEEVRNKVDPTLRKYNAMQKATPENVRNMIAQGNQIPEEKRWMNATALLEGDKIDGLRPGSKIRIKDAENEEFKTSDFVEFVKQPNGRWLASSPDHTYRHSYSGWDMADWINELSAESSYIPA